MKKIKDLLIKAGCKPELVGQIAESMAEYKKTIDEQYKADYAAKITAAKKVCLEETENHKRELSRRLAIFCEAKSASIEAQLAKKSAINESVAASKLQSLKNVLEGVAANGSPNPKVTAVLRKAERQIKTMKESQQKTLAAANRKVAIAEKVLKNNRKLVAENTMLKEKLQSGLRPKPTSTRLDENRQRSVAKTTRATILENQDRSTKAPVRNTTAKPGVFGVNEIANVMDDSLI